MKALILVLCLAVISGKMLRFLQGGIDAAASDAKGFKGFGEFKNNVNKVMGMYDKIAQTFASSTWNTIQGIIDQQGYETLKLHSNYMGNGNVRLTGWDTFWDLTLETLELGEELTEDAKLQLEFGAYAEETTWSQNLIAFDNSKATDHGEMRVVNLLANVRQEDKRFDAIVFDYSVSFKMAPKLVIRCKGKSIAGGMYNKSDTVIEEQAQVLKPEEIDALLQYFQLLSYQMIAAIAGVQVDLKLKA